jgi:HEAT repeat protein
LVKKLGDFKAVESEDEIYKAFRDTNDLLVKTEAVTALGRIESKKYIDEYITLLRNINMKLYPTANTRELEGLAYALISMFENLRDKSSYDVVFYASVGWYTPKSGIKEKAKKLLPLITDDPTETLFEILTKDADFNNKYIALQSERESSAPDTKKSEFATEALNQGLMHVPNNNIQTSQLAQIRLLACKMLQSSSVKDPKAISYLEKMMFNRYDINEKLTTIETLGTYKSEEAAIALTKFLRQNNEWQEQGNTRLIDTRSVLATISALSESGSKAGVEELIIVGTLKNYKAEILKAAEAAIQKLNK